MQVIALLAAFVPLAAAQTLHQICGADVVGLDVSTFKSPNPDTCAFLVPNVGDCASWTNYNGGTCWLKKHCTQFPPVNPNVGASTFVRRQGNDGEFGIVYTQFDADMPGFDVGTALGDLNDCNHACRDHPKCFAYTWTDYNGGTCWLKSRASAFVNKSRAISYIAMRPSGSVGACPPV